MAWPGVEPGPTWWSQWGNVLCENVSWKWSVFGRLILQNVLKNRVQICREMQSGNRCRLTTSLNKYGTEYFGFLNILEMSLIVSEYKFWLIHYYMNLCSYELTLGSMYTYLFTFISKCWRRSMLINILLPILITFKAMIIVSRSGLYPEYSTQHVLAVFQLVLSPCECYVR